MDFQVNQISFEAYCAHNFYVDRPDGPESYAYVHFLRPMMVWQEGNFVPVKKDTFAVFSPGHCQKYYPRTEDMLENWCHFEYPEMDALMERLGLPMNTPFSVRDSSAADSIFRTVFSSWMDRNEQAVSLGMESLLLYLGSAHQTIQEQSGASRQLYDLRLSLQSRLEEDWTVASMAAELSYSPSYFNKIYRKTFGISPKQDLSRMRLERARYLLYSTSCPVEQISRMLHYQSSTSFISKFHNAVGMTPLQYRKQWRRRG